MRIVYLDVNSNRSLPQPVVACIGYFDGMHLGHQALVRRTIEMARAEKCESAMITFEPDPWVTIRGAKNVRHISTMRERMNKAVALGIENIVILRFTTEMSQLSPEDFVNHVLGQLNLKGLVCGFDFHYGYHGQGNAESLKKQAGYEVDVIQEIDDSIGKISSTRITECIESGDMVSAARMLGSYFSIEGIVIHGRHVGTGMGFPTANLKYSSEYLLPQPGVYAGFGIVDGRRYMAMINLGHNPTVNYQENLSLEVHLMHFHGDLYDHYLKVEFVKFLREEMKFKNVDNLILQLEQDSYNIRRILEREQKDHE
jgi:riboflavin kinase/FMN adenylyltransferase